MCGSVLGRVDAVLRTGRVPGSISELAPGCQPERYFIKNQQRAPSICDACRRGASALGASHCSLWAVVWGWLRDGIGNGALSPGTWGILNRG